jgi:hypothetical protein
MHGAREAIMKLQELLLGASSVAENANTPIFVADFAAQR